MIVPNLTIIKFQVYSHHLVSILHLLRGYEQYLILNCYGRIPENNY